MDTPNQTVYEALFAIDGVEEVGKPSRNVFTTFPALTYAVSQNQVNRDLNNEIASQNVEVNVDIWHDSSVGATALLTKVEEAMRGLSFNLDFSSEVPNPDPNVFHISTRFRATNV